MKVILIKDIPRVGNKYDVREVSAGYARNFLIPRGFAKLATEKELAHIKEAIAAQKQKADLDHDLLIKNIESLSGAIITMQGKVNEKGHLFAGIHKEEIARRIKEEKNIEIPNESILLEEPLKEAGEHVITLQTEGVHATLTLVIEAAK